MRRGTAIAKGVAATLALCLAAAGASIEVVSVVAVDRAGVLAHRVSGDETAQTCRRFRLTQRDAREFFAKAVPVQQQVYEHLDGSNCVTLGHLRRADGSSGRWTIDLERRGELILASGRRLLFYCGRCTSPRYDEADEDSLSLVGTR